MLLYLIPSFTPLLHKQFNLVYISCAARDSVPAYSQGVISSSFLCDQSSIQLYASGHWELSLEGSRKVSFHSSQLSDTVCCMSIWTFLISSGIVIGTSSCRLFFLFVEIEVCRFKKTVKLVTFLTG